jgi:precorrin-4 methylase
VLTGQENWQRTANGAYYLGSSACPNNYKKTLSENIVLCTHYGSQIPTTGSAAVLNNNISFYGGTSATYELYIGARDVVDTESFKQFLADEYSAGHPVTVWYVLATPETAVVNEPLRKIGNYADTLSYEQAGVQIPTNRGNTVIDVETTLKASEMYIKYQE